MRLRIALALVVLGCGQTEPMHVGAADAGAPARSDAGAAADAAIPPDAGRAADAGLACETAKILFTQANGCANDGSIEFCIPNTAEALARAQQVDGRIVRQVPTTPGRVGCDVDAEYLCFLPLDEADCVARWGAMTDAAWQVVCALSRLDEVRRIAHTIYE